MWTPTYYVRLVPLPATIDGVTLPNDDGTFDIYINATHSETHQQDSLQHEINHIMDDHFYQETRSVAALEAEANGSGSASPAPPSVSVRLLPGPAPQFSLFRSSAFPEDVAFAFYIPDNSMRPHFKKDQLVRCDNLALRSGDVGLFQYNGETILRQYHKDIFGMIYLFTLGKRRDSTLLRPCNEKDLICLGRVQMQKRLALPGM